MPFICKNCNHSFNSQIKLKKHMDKRVSCVADANLLDPLKCIFCNKSFSTKYNLLRHDPTCLVRNNPELLIQQIEKHKEFMTNILAKKDEVIDVQNRLLSQQADAIENLKELKPRSNIDINNKIEAGDNAQIDASANIDNSIHIKELHVHLTDLPVGFRTGDMNVFINKIKETPGEYFRNLRRVIMDSAKNGKIDKSIENLMIMLHDSSSFKEGHNIRYCKEGKYKGKLLIYDYDDNDNGSWYVADIEPVSKIISNEFKKFNQLHASINNDNETNKDTNDTQDIITDPTNKKEKANVEKYHIDSERLEFNIEHRDTIFKIVKRFKISSDSVPSNISEDTKKLGKNDKKISCRGKLEKKAIKVLESEKIAKSKKSSSVDEHNGQLSDYKPVDDESNIIVVKGSAENSESSSSGSSSDSESKSSRSCSDKKSKKK